MRARTGWVIASIVLMPALAAAQDGLRSASLPERSLAQDRRDVFRATPDTYRPRLDGSLLPQWWWPGVPQIGWGMPAQVIYVPVDMSALLATRRDYDHERGDDAAPSRREPEIERYQPAAPGKPKTFYVIPGCYGGDRRPDPASLAPGCSLSDLRIINP